MYVNSKDNNPSNVKHCKKLYSCYVYVNANFMS